jgi:hypothetical protein
MKRLVVLAAIAASAFLGYRYLAGRSPESIYKKFANQMLHRNYADAAKLADGLSESDLQQFGKEGLNPAMMQTLFPSKYEIQSTEKQPDGSVTVHAMQTVFFNPPGVESALRPAMYATLKQVVTLRKASGGWRVSAYSSNVEKMDSVSGR